MTESQFDKVVRGNREVKFDKYTDRAIAVLQCADLEAKRLGHQFIGTEHLLLGLVREGDGIGAATLQRMGIDLAKIRLAVEAVIGYKP